MDDFVKKNISHDNALEDYFIELIIRKKVVHREVESLLATIQTSPLHRDYSRQLRQLLFGTNNLYLENWGTLEDGFLDVIRGSEIRSGHVRDHGIILEIVLRIMEDVFDIHDDHAHDFILLEQRETIENALILLIKKILEYISTVLIELLSGAAPLSAPPHGHYRAEYTVMEKTLLALPGLLIEKEVRTIQSLKNEVNTLYQDALLAKKRRYEEED